MASRVRRGFCQIGGWDRQCVIKVNPASHHSKPRSLTCPLSTPVDWLPLTNRNHLMPIQGGKARCDSLPGSVMEYGFLFAWIPPFDSTMLTPTSTCRMWTSSHMLARCWVSRHSGHMPITPALGRWKQEDQTFKVVFSYIVKFQAILGYLRTCLNIDQIKMPC